jgi:hypothetical protein
MTSGCEMPPLLENPLPASNILICQLAAVVPTDCIASTTDIAYESIDQAIIAGTTLPTWKEV